MVGDGVPRWDDVPLASEMKKSKSDLHSLESNSDGTGGLGYVYGGHPQASLTRCEGAMLLAKLVGTFSGACVAGGS